MVIKAIIVIFTLISCCFLFGLSAYIVNWKKGTPLWIIAAFVFCFLIAVFTKSVLDKL